MLFNQGNRDLAFKNNRNSDDYYIEHVEVLPASDEQETSDIEKRFKEPLRDLSKVQKELNSISKEMKHRMREVRKNNGDELDYEKDMYQTRASVMDSKIKVADKKARIIKDMLATELKDKKFQKDVSGIGGGSNNPDMRGHYASYFSGSNDRGANDNKGLNTNFLSNPESSKRRMPPKPKDFKENNTQQNNNPQNRQDNRSNQNRDPKKDDLSNKDLNELEQQYGLDYSSSATNLKNKDKNLKEVVHIDKEKDVFWLEVKDEEGNTIDKARKKHIDQIGEIEVDKKEDVVRDSFNNAYEYVEDDAENMDDMYIEQWREKGHLEDM